MVTLIIDWMIELYCPGQTLFRKVLKVFWTTNKGLNKGSGGTSFILVYPNVTALFIYLFYRKYTLIVFIIWEVLKLENTVCFLLCRSLRKLENLWSLSHMGTMLVLIMVSTVQNLQILLLSDGLTMGKLLNW